MRDNYTIIDTTLREGEQTPGTTFSLADKFRILDGLARVGVDEAELGISSQFTSCTGPLVRYCRSHHPQLSLSLWSRCNSDDIEHAGKLQPDILSLSIPVSDIHLHKRLKKDRRWAKISMIDGLRQAIHLGMVTSIGFEDATRSDPLFLREMARTAVEHGASRIRIADTVGISSPGRFANLISDIKVDIGNCRLAVHTHNDFGMATANGVAAVEAGANSVDTVVLGLGERTGCARLEEVAGYFSLIHGDQRYKPEHLKPLADLLASLTGKNIPGNQPLVGEDIFTCETGLHVQGLQADPVSYEPFPPERVLAERKMLFGAKSGRRALSNHITQLTGGQMEKLPLAALSNIRRTATQLGRTLSDSEILSLDISRTC